MTAFPASMPYDTVNVFDQSEYIDKLDVEPINNVPSGPIAYIPFVSERGYGEDDKLTYMDSSILAKYGKPNFKKYGLSLYLANRFASGGGTVLGKRLVSDDATCSNALIYANLKRNTDICEKNETGKIIINEFFELNNNFGEKFLNTSNFQNRAAIEEDIATYTNPWTVIFTAHDNSNVKLYYYSYIETVPNVHLADSETEYGIHFSDIYPVNLIDSDGEVHSNICITNPSTAQYAIVNPDGAGYILVRNVIVVVDGAVGGEYWMSIGKINMFSATSVKLKKTNISSLKKDSDINFDKIKSSIKSAEYSVGDENIINTNTRIDSLEYNTDYFYPLFVISSKAHGNFTNAFKFNITEDTNMNELILDSANPNAFLYNIETTDSYDSTSLDRTLTFTFNPDYIYNREAMYVEDVFADYANHLNFKVCDGFNYYKYLIGSIVNYATNIENPYKNNPILWLNDFDYLFGTNLLRYNILYNTTDDNAINLKQNQMLKGGSDGAFGNVNDYHFADIENGENYTDPFAAAMTAAYGYVTSGTSPSTIDKESMIWNEYRYPFEYVYAPCYDENVMVAIHQLVMNRNITHARYFTPKFSKYSMVRDWAVSETSNTSSANFGECNAFKEVKESEWYLIKDPYTYKNLYVPNVYMHAFYEPNHWLINKGKPYAGISNYRFSDFKLGSAIPQSASSDEYISNHKIGLNTVLENGYGYAIPYEQITAQQSVKTSALSEINNVYTLTNMIRIALSLAQNKRWQIGFDASAYKTELEQAIANELGNCYESLVIYTKQESANGAGKNRIYCKLNVVFNKILKGVTYDFYILLNQE